MKIIKQVVDLINNQLIRGEKTFINNLFCNGRIQGRILSATGNNNEILNLKNHKVYLGESQSTLSQADGNIFLKQNGTRLELIGSFEDDSFYSILKELNIVMPVSISNSMTSVIPIPISSWNRPFKIKRIDIFTQVSSPGLTNDDYWRIDLRTTNGNTIGTNDLKSDIADTTNIGHIKQSYIVDYNMPVFPISGYYGFRLTKIGNPGNLNNTSISIEYVRYIF